MHSHLNIITLGQVSKFFRVFGDVGKQQVGEVVRICHELFVQGFILTSSPRPCKKRRIERL